MTDFFALARARCSVRNFSGRPIEPETLRRILEAGNLAPTAKNVQPQHIYVLQSPEALEKANRLTPCVYGAPVVLVFAYDREAAFHNVYDSTVCSGDQDVTLAGAHIMLAAWELGVGSCWVNRFDPAATKALLGLPEREQVVFLLPLGYPDESFQPDPRHTQRKPLAETVTML